MVQLRPGQVTAEGSAQGRQAMLGAGAFALGGKQEGGESPQTNAERAVEAGNKEGRKNQAFSES